MNNSKEKENICEERLPNQWASHGTNPTDVGEKSWIENSMYGSWGHSAVPNSPGWKVKAHLAPLKTYPCDTAQCWTGHLQNSEFYIFLMLFKVLAILQKNSDNMVQQGLLYVCFV